MEERDLKDISVLLDKYGADAATIQDIVKILDDKKQDIVAARVYRELIKAGEYCINIMMEHWQETAGDIPLPPMYKKRIMEEIEIAAGYFSKDIAQIKINKTKGENENE